MQLAVSSELISPRLNNLENVLVKIPDGKVCIEDGLAEVLPQVGRDQADLL